MGKKGRTKKTADLKFKNEIIFEIYGITILVLSIISMAGLGAIGRNLNYLSRFIVGYMDFVVPIIGIAVGVYVMVKRKWPDQWTVRMTGLLIIFLSLLAWIHFNTFYQLQLQGFEGSVLDRTWELLLQERTSRLPLDVGGGMIGAFIYSLFHFLFADNGTIIVLGSFILCGLLLATGFSYVYFFRTLRKIASKQKKQWKQSIASYLRKRVAQKRKEEGRQKMTPVFPNITAEELEKGKEEYSSPIISDFEDTNPKKAEQLHIHWQAMDEEKAKPVKKTISQEETTEKGSEGVNIEFHSMASSERYEIPPLPLLDEIRRKGQIERQDLNANAEKLEETLNSFGVQARVTHIHRGPAVTRYEVQPQMGVKVSRIVNLSDDLALALAAKDIRIEAPIPGKAAIGIEVPNPEVAVVSLREVLESDDYMVAGSKLSISLGRDITGEPKIANLTKMPHLLVAGATGSGKSVCINGIIISLLYKAKPHEVKLMMIDPKMVELNIYNGIPHLLAPVVTDPRKAALALKKVVAEMEKRYQKFADKGARDMERYNQLATANGETPLPYIVVIVDELADLMMVAPADVEDAICRLAQMARAAGIHLILATQRPSVDVITGVIKANIPSRIAFAVSSQADSRTILDMGGAEKLLGRGDMLYLPVGAAKPIRVQGAFLSDDEVERVIQFVKGQQEAKYNEEMIPKSGEVSQMEQPADELFPQAVQLVVEAKTASISLLQRRLRIGYSRAARLIDLMEERGIVGPYEGSKPREVLITSPDWDREKSEASG